MFRKYINWVIVIVFLVSESWYVGMFLQFEYYCMVEIIKLGIKNNSVLKIIFDIRCKILDIIKN